MPETCPTCGGELKWVDYFGRWTKWNQFRNEPVIEHEGDIYKCQNEECQECWHTLGDSELKQGYPC
jgi:hypothetical protein